MRIADITFEYHDTLNSKIWDGDDMRLEVQVTLLKSAYAFCEFLELPDLKIEGIHFVGSNASFNYTDYSDCDVHVIINYDESPFPIMAKNFFDTKKTLWNQTHKAVEVMGYKVELYAEDVSDEPVAAGIYDLLNGVWLKKPEKKEPDVDSSAVEAKTNALINEIDTVCLTGEKDEIEDMFARLREMRRAGLAAAGEFSTENLAFKAVRNLGYIDKLSASRLKAQDSDLSLDHHCPICETPEGGLNRCTVQTVNALASYFHFQPITHETQIPITGADVIHYLEGHGMKQAQRDQSAPGKSLAQWVPAHRSGCWYVSTDGHAMALINGVLVDAEHKGPDNRRIICAIEFRR